MGLKRWLWERKQLRKYPHLRRVKYLGRLWAVNRGNPVFEEWLDEELRKIHLTRNQSETN